MKKSIFTVIILSIFSLTGCDDDGSGNSKYNGIYEITSAQEQIGCGEGNWTEMTTEEDYFLLEGTEFFGLPMIGFSFCTGETKDSCDDSFDLSMSFMKESGEWVNSSEYSMSSGTCFLSRTQGTLEESETGVTITSITLEGTVELDAGDECDYELIDKYLDQLTCSTSVIEGTILN